MSGREISTQDTFSRAWQKPVVSVAVAHAHAMAAVLAASSSSTSPSIVDTYQPADQAVQENKRAAKRQIDDHDRIPCAKRAKTDELTDEQRVGVQREKLPPLVTVGIKQIFYPGGVRCFCVF
jgi:hypothetical protein